MTHQMLSLLLGLLGVLLCTPAQAHFPNQRIDEGELAAVQAGTLYVVESGDSEFDEALLEAAQANWTLGTVQSVAAGGYADARINPSSFFLGAITLVSETHSSSGDTRRVVYELLAVWRGRPKLGDNIRWSDVLVMTERDAAALEPAPSDMDWRLGGAVSGLQDALQSTVDNEARGTTRQRLARHRWLVNQRSAQLSQLTLVVRRDYLHPGFSSKDLLDAYPYAVEVVDAADVDELRQEKSTGHAYLVLARGGSRSLTIHRTSDDLPIYTAVGARIRGGLGRDDVRIASRSSLGYDRANFRRYGHTWLLKPDVLPQGAAARVGLRYSDAIWGVTEVGYASASADILGADIQRFHLLGGLDFTPLKNGPAWLYWGPRLQLATMRATKEDWSNGVFTATPSAAVGNRWVIHPGLMFQTGVNFGWRQRFGGGDDGLHESPNIDLVWNNGFVVSAEIGIGVAFRAGHFRRGR